MRKDHRKRESSVKNEKGDYTRTYKDNGKKYHTKEYSLWHNMYNRVYSGARHKSDPRYAGCKLEFTDYNTFTEWLHSQIGFDREGWVMDKDIVCHLTGMGKVYSPETCVFVPILINSFLTFSQKTNNSTGYAGVSVINSKGYSANFMACCAELNGKNKTLGRTNTAEEGYQLYREHKVKLAKVLADTYRDEVDPRVTYYLENFSNYIDDLAVFKQNKQERHNV
jgi:hypothetical protein